MAWERNDARQWRRAILTAQRIWKKVERTCKIDRNDLAIKVSRSTTKGGKELWNPHHYLLDSFERKPPLTHQDVNKGFRQAKTSTSDKRLYDEIANTYADIAVNMGAIRQIAIKKMRKQYVCLNLSFVIPSYPLSLITCLTHCLR